MPVKKTAPAELDLSGAKKAALAVLTEEPLEPPAVTRLEVGKTRGIRLTDEEYNRFRSVFAKNGLNFTEGCRMAITLCVELIEAGAFSMSKSGIHDTRKGF
jgi:hypothetical protein